MKFWEKRKEAKRVRDFKAWAKETSAVSEELRRSKDCDQGLQAMDQDGRVVVPIDPWDDVLKDRPLEQPVDYGHYTDVLRENAGPDPR